MKLSKFKRVFMSFFWVNTLKKILALCNKRPGHNFVDAFEKWAVDRETWSQPLYPRCCYGPAYILTPDSVLGIVDAYEKSLVTFSKFEDIYITGKIPIYN